MRSLLELFSNRRMLILLLLGFSSGLPLALITGTLQAWFTEEGVNLRSIGSFSFVTLPYALKFLWAPFLDRFIPKVFGSYGRRLGWMLCSQFLLIVLIACVGVIDPQQDYWLLFALCSLLAFTSATQDIVIDAYRADLLTREELGPGSSVAIFGYRLGMLTSGAVALSLAQVLPWQTVYCGMAIVQGVGVLAAYVAPKINDVAIRPRNLRDAVVLPLIEYFNRRGAIELLLFIVLYKLADVMGLMFTTPFMLGLGFSKAEIAAVVKGFGLVATIVGSLAGGMLMVRLGMKRGLLLFGVLQGVANLSFAVLAIAGKSYYFMAFAIGIENLCSGLGTAAFTAFITGLCHHKFTATQFALLTSLSAVTRSLMGRPCGILVEQVNWPVYFVICTAAALPGLLMILLRYDRWVTEVERTTD